MSVFIGSRYQYGTVSYLSLTRDGDTQAVVRYSPTDLTSSSTHYVICSKGDRFDKIANDVYGDSTLWWRIAELNPLVNYLSVLRPGQIIRVPDA